MDNMDNSGINTIILVLIFALVVFGMVWFLKSDQNNNQEGPNVELNIPPSSNGQATE